MPVLDLLQLQGFKETVWGTVGTPTIKFMGIEKFKFKPNVKTERTKELRASMAKAFNAAVVVQDGAAEVEGYCLYEDINYFLESMAAVVVPTGAGPYVRVGACPLGTAPVPRFMSFIYGESIVGAQVLLGGMVQKLTITGKYGAICKFKAELIGMKVTGTGATLAALTDRVVTPITPDQWAIYLDTWAGTVGTTVVPATFYEFELEFDAARVLLAYLGGIAPQGYDQPWVDCKLKLKAQFNATSAPFLTALLDPTAVFNRQIRLKATKGTNIMQFDFAGVAEKAPNDLWPDRNRVTAMDIEMFAEYNPTLANQWLYSNTSGLATL
jgi:hypothetical protein